MNPSSASKTRIFVVDDHALIRRGLASIINEQVDMVVCGEAVDATTGLDEIVKTQPEVVILDISLHGNSGLELLKSVKTFCPKIKSLMFSMHHESIYALRALKAGARGYVMKHDPAEKIIEAIRRIRDGQLYLSADVAALMLNRLVTGDSGENTCAVDALSDRELEIVTLIGNGMLTREIAVVLHLSVKTVETHRSHIKRKLALDNANQLVQFCIRWTDENHTEQRGNRFSHSTPLNGNNVGGALVSKQPTYALPLEKTA